MSITPNKNASPITATGSIALLLTLCALSMTSCVSNVSSQVKETNKDTTGTFDGTWIANVQKSASRQYMPGNWIANCHGSAWDFRVKVADGVVENNLPGSTESTYVSSTGDFRFDIPVKEQAEASARSDLEIALPKQSMVVYGNLKKAKGRYTFAVADFGNNGCTAIIEFDKIGA